MTLGCRPPVSHALPAKAQGGWAAASAEVGQPGGPRTALHALGRRCFANWWETGRRCLLEVTANAFARLDSTRSAGGGAASLGWGALLPPLPRGGRPFLPFLPAKKRFPLPLPLTSPSNAWLFLAAGVPGGSLPLPACPEDEEGGGDGRAWSGS